MTDTPNKLAEAIERLRRRPPWQAIGPRTPLADDVLAVCDAAARVGELERERDEAREWAAINAGQTDEARALLDEARALLDESRELRMMAIRQREAAYATLSGIERLLRAGWIVRHHSLPLYEDQWVVEDPNGFHRVWADSLAAAVQAALAELEKEPK